MDVIELLVLFAVLQLLAVLAFAISPYVRPRRFKLKGSHVIITGGSSGIGKAVAVEAVKNGASVTLMARKKAKLLEAQQEVEKYVQEGSKQRVNIIVLDVADEYSKVEQAFKEAVSELGPCDMLVNSAGVSCSKAFVDTDIEEFENVMKINLNGTVQATRAVLDQMMSRQRGRIVLISSQAGQIGLYGFTAYSASKFALRGFAESLQMEVKPYDIYVTVNCPPDTDTPMLQAESNDKPKETQLISETAGLFQPDVVAKIILKDSQRGVFLSYVGLDGFLLKQITCGMSTVISTAEALQQVFLVGICRAIGLFYLTSFDKIVHKCKREREMAAITEKNKSE
ncbi:3-ketodihydrosphingosine reductase-like isoform X2 [Anneissia japonica]|uniref:3-ketodihydrosphingosine reductase-like isoform X2 n=1 Tax=Anneissia japonica TaxID=1529436 RepID=UPI00142568A9|nr:3-ketodihydrosphingosine reductase-like isoform X2 [Anneissia japonica]